MNHENKVKKISKQLKMRKSKKPLTFVKKAVSHQMPKFSKSQIGNSQNDIVNLRDLNEILKIDQKKKTCIAEPGVTFSDLVKETLKYNLVPYTVPELKDITIGGVVSGCSVESMSFKYGGFHDSCIEYEVINAKGDILACSDKKNKKLFHIMHGTFGTLGIITKLKFKLHPAKPYVHIINEKYKTLEAYKKGIQSHYTKKDCDFMDGIIHSKTSYILCIGSFTDTAPYTNKYDWMKIYYKSTFKRKEDYIKTYDYFFRYDSGCHWISRNYGLDNPILRFLFGKALLPSTKMLKLAKKLQFIFKHVKPDVVVDVFIPFSKMNDFFKFYNKKFNYYPLWIVPYHINKLYPWANPQHFKNIKDKLLIDIAIYGMKQGKNNYYRMMEEHLLKLPGIKTLISHNYLSKKEFYKMWSKTNYEEIKNITDPDNILRDMYTKTCGK